MQNMKLNKHKKTIQRNNAIMHDYFKNWKTKNVILQKSKMASNVCQKQNTKHSFYENEISFYLF